VILPSLTQPAKQDDNEGVEKVLKGNKTSRHVNH